ncbi:HNH endonuclease [Sansalvadorimonas verongulae]|nr:HNH endonuclease [Sansalvadorimonas verongulae]
MPARLKRACRKPGCPGTTTHRSGYCDKHQPEEGSWNKWQQKKGNTTQRGYGYKWQKLRAQILKRDSYLCQECKRKGVIREGRHVDHITPKAAGGTDEPGNLQTLCTTCHNHKTATERASKG